MSASVLKPSSKHLKDSKELTYHDTDTQSAKNGFFQAVDNTATTQPKKR